MSEITVMSVWENLLECCIRDDVQFVAHSSNLSFNTSLL